MSNIVSSTLSYDLQIGGRKQVHEVHTDIIGLTHTVDYLADAGLDADGLNANMAVNAASLSQALHDAEINANLSAIMSQGPQAVPTNVYSSVADNVAAAKAAFPSMDVASAMMFAAFLAAKSDAVLEQVYALTATQVANLRALPTLQQQQTALADVVNPGGS